MHLLVTAAKNLRDACAESDGEVLPRESLKDLFQALREVEKSPVNTTAFTEPEAAKLLHCSARTLQARRASGELKEGVHYSYLAGHVLYAPIHIARIIEGIRKV